MQIILQKSKVYLIFYVFLLKILSIFAIKTSKRATHYLEPPDLFLCTLYIVPLYLVLCTLSLCTLPHLLSCEGVDLVSEENEDLAVDEDLCTLYIVTLYILHALALLCCRELRSVVGVCKSR